MQLVRPDIYNLILQNVLDDSGVTKDQYEDALEVTENKVSIVYKRKLSKVYISPYNTVLLSC